MESRRSFLIKSITILAAFFFSCAIKIKSDKSAKRKPQLKRALILWYSQTGNTQRAAQLIAHVWKRIGLDVKTADMRDFDKKTINQYDLITIGTPVFYWDIPVYVKDWLSDIPQINGVSVASFVTYGGPEGNQYNSACTSLQLLVQKGGIPVGLDTFMNMGTFPPTWSSVLMYKHLPDKNTYEQVRNFASKVINNIKQGISIDITKKITIRRFANVFVSMMSMTKKDITKHTIDKTKCIKCGTCANICPSKAINLSNQTINTNVCQACFGCINNCPAQAIEMEYNKKKIYGYKEFLKQNNIKIKEPVELQKL